MRVGNGFPELSTPLILLLLAHRWTNDWGMGVPYGLMASNEPQYLRVTASPRHHTWSNHICSGKMSLGHSLPGALTVTTVCRSVRNKINGPNFERSLKYTNWGFARYGITKINHCTIRIFRSYIQQRHNTPSIAVDYFSDTLPSKSLILIIMYHIELTPESYKSMKYLCPAGVMSF